MSWPKVEISLWEHRLVSVLDNALRKLPVRNDATLEQKVLLLCLMLFISNFLIKICPAFYIWRAT